jgi:MYXO-CTERM domain-containing protein
MDGLGCIDIGSNSCAVPEPASFMTFGLGLAGLFGFGLLRRKRA